MAEAELQLEVVAAAHVSDAMRDEIIALLDRGYGQPMLPYLSDLGLDTHVIGRIDGTIVSHAAWVARYLQAGQAPMMRAAYIEMVATDPVYQRRGYGAAVMRLLAESITQYDIGALCPSDAGQALYPALGWEYWRGPLFIRDGRELVPTPDERVMVLRLPRTPSLDLDGPLSAEWRPGELW